MSEAQKELLKTIFWDMNELSAHTEPDGAKVQTYTIAPTMVPWDPSDPTRPTHPSTPTTPPSEPEQPVTLVITMTGKPPRLQNCYQLTAEQRSHMEEMLRPENAALLNEVLWDIPYISGAVVDGWAYPLPEEGTITEYYRMRVHPSPVPGCCIRDWTLELRKERQSLQSGRGSSRQPPTTTAPGIM